MGTRMFIKRHEYGVMRCGDMVRNMVLDMMCTDGLSCYCLFSCVQKKTLNALTPVETSPSLWY
ncbi:hypothetical protein EON63_22205 [archaeon]|nr:MAG: hypothetical protein EON63_22205 [archaeon]